MAYKNYSNSRRKKSYLDRNILMIICSIIIISLCLFLVFITKTSLKDKTYNNSINVDKNIVKNKSNKIFIKNPTNDVFGINLELLEEDKDGVIFPKVNPYSEIIKSVGLDLSSNDDEYLGNGLLGDTKYGSVTGDEDLPKKRVYLTFDDGPSSNTQEILDILDRNGVKATFFVIGKTDDASKARYKAIVDSGNVIAMHSYSHDYDALYASVESFADEVKKISDLIYECTGVRTKYFRFPGGSSNSVSKLPITEYIKYLNEQGLRYYDWNALNNDAVTKGLSTTELNSNIMQDVRKYDVSVVLMHDLGDRYTTVEALQDLIDTLKNEGYAILPIDDNTPLIQHVKYDSVGDSGEGDND